MKPKRSFTCDLCGEDTFDWYMVHDEVWAQVMPTPKGLLHLGCLEVRLGRPLTLADLKEGRANLEIRFGYAMAQREMALQGRTE